MTTITLAEKIAAVERAISQCKRRAQRSSGFMLNESALREIGILEAALADLRMFKVNWDSVVAFERRAGAEEMRERAARLVDDWGDPSMERLANTIRALPVE